MRPIDYDIYLKTRICSTLGWVSRHKDNPVESGASPLNQLFQKEQEEEVLKKSRILFEPGVWIEGENPDGKHQKTLDALRNPHVGLIFKGYLKGFATETEFSVLEKKQSGLHLIAVKASTRNKKRFIQEMVFKAWFLEKMGFPVESASVLYISREYRLGMEERDFFRQDSVTHQVRLRKDEPESHMEQVRRITSEAEKPHPHFCYYCRKCPLFKDCYSFSKRDTVFELSQLNLHQFRLLMEKNIRYIKEIPESFPLNQHQKKIKASILSGKPVVNEKLEKALKSVVWPAFYLDFESVVTAIPLFPHVKPFGYVPTQYSVHQCSAPDEIDFHREYMGKPGEDCRREFAEKLIRDLEGKGSILVYSAFEKGIIRKLSEMFPDLSNDLNALIYRLLDLQALIRNYFWHPDFRGSIALKRVLPVLVPEMSYEDLDIGEGATAMASYAYLIMGRYGEEEAGRVKDKLLEYCRQDTLALVKLHAHLLSFIS